MKLFELAQKIGAELTGDGDIEINGVAAIHEAASDEITFISNPKYAPLADAAFAQAAELFYTPAPAAVPGIHPTALVADDAELGEGVCIGPFCVVEAGAVIGRNTVVSAQAYVGHQVRIGADSFLYPQVSIRESCVIGDRVVIHNGTVIGSDGFGYSVNDKGVRTKIKQIGIVQIGDDVEIGANVTIDRARFGKTSVGRGTKIDNLVQIAHNVTIGEDCVLIAQVGLAGSSSVGDRVILAGQVGIAGHLTIGNDTVIAGKAGVTKDVQPGEYLMGMPAVPANVFKRNLAMVALLPKLKKRITDLEAEIRKLAQ